MVPLLKGNHQKDHIPRLSTYDIIQRTIHQTHWTHHLCPKKYDDNNYRL
jgi:hypothetical protein